MSSEKKTVMIKLRTRDGAYCNVQADVKVLDCGVVVVGTENKRYFCFVAGEPNDTPLFMEAAEALELPTFVLPDEEKDPHKRYETKLISLCKELREHIQNRPPLFSDGEKSTSLTATVLQRELLPSESIQFTKRIVNWIDAARFRYISEPSSEVTAEVKQWMERNHSAYQDELDLAVDCAHYLLIFDKDQMEVDPKQDHAIPAFIIEMAQEYFN